MALTRITSTVLEANAVNAEKMANGSLTTRLYGIKSIPLSALSNEANTASAETRLDANINVLQTNLNIVHANVVAAQANIISANTAMAANAAANDFLTFTSLTSAINATTNNTNIISANVEFVENRRISNLAGAVSTISKLNLTASRAMVSLANGKVGVLASVTSTELGYVDATSSIQTQLNAGITKINQTSTNVAAIVSGTNGFTGQVTMADDLVIQGNLTVLGESVTANTRNAVIQDRFLMLANSATGAPSADVGIFMNRGNQGNAAIFYDESAKSFTMAETRDPDANVVVSPTGLANLAVGTLKYNGADLNTAITDNRSGAISTVYKDNLTASRVVVSDGSGKLAISTATATEVGYLGGVSSAIQTQLTAGVTESTALEARRAANIAGAVSSITTGNLTASRALVSDGSGKVAALASVTTTELAFLDATSSVQTQLDAKIAITASAANDFITFQRLNANINIVSSNVALGLTQLINVAASSTGAGSGNNVFFIATPAGGNPVAINNVIVSLNGITQAKTTDYIYTPATGAVTFTDAAIPDGLTVQIITLNPPS